MVDPGPSSTGLVTSLPFLDRMIVYAGNINRFLEDGQGHWNQVWAAGVPEDGAMRGGGWLYEPVGVPSRSYTPFCLDEKLAVRLWDWTEEELKPWLA